jgi:hypothetical protein
MASLLWLCLFPVAILPFGDGFNLPWNHPDVFGSGLAKETLIS